MSNLDIIRAWKDEQYRHSLSADEQALLPDNPAGQIELTDSELQDVDGGTVTSIACSVIATVTVSIAICASVRNWGSCPVNTNGCC